MDYVVFGIGFGATILVLGLLLRDFGPRLRFRQSRDGEDVLSAEELVGKVSWTRFCNALGSVLALAGAVFLLLTLVAMILVVSDETGLWVMSVAFAVLIVVMAYWTWAYFHRFGSYGILPERAEPKPALVAPRREEQQPVMEHAYARSPASPVDDDPDDESEPAADEESEPSRDDPEAAPEADVIASEPDDAPVADAVEVSDAPSTVGETESASSSHLETPEERLAHAETPIDHGSAEGDLDLAASAHRRPGARTPKRTEPLESPDATSGEPAPADERDRA